MLYGLAISGDTADARRKALDAALDQLRTDLLCAPIPATQKFFNQPGKLVLYVKSSVDDVLTADKFKRD